MVRFSRTIGLLCGSPGRSFRGPVESGSAPRCRDRLRLPKQVWLATLGTTASAFGCSISSR